MKKTNINKNTVKAFFALLKAGLWGQPVELRPYTPIDFEVLYSLAIEQSIVGLVAAGLEQVSDMRVTKQQVLPFMKRVYALENRNQAMNLFIGKLVESMRRTGIKTLLVKGQGIGQCYERPQWREPGDVDLFLDEKNYYKAKEFLLPISSSHSEEIEYEKHLDMVIDSWTVEIHGTLRSRLTRKIDMILDDIQNEVFSHGLVRTWNCSNTVIYLPSADNDVLFVFTHILKHFFRGGIGLRQVCDWCRLLWTYKDSMNESLLNRRLKEMGLLSEWKVFASFAVCYLGMPQNALPLYDDASQWKRKAKGVNSFIMRVGSFGHKLDISYYKKYPYIIRKMISFYRRLSDTIERAIVFPVDSFRVFSTVFVEGMTAVLKKE